MIVRWPLVFVSSHHDSRRLATFADFWDGFPPTDSPCPWRARKWSPDAVSSDFPAALNCRRSSGQAGVHTSLVCVRNMLAGKYLRFSECGFEIRCRLCRLRVRLPCPPLPNPLHRKGFFNALAAAVSWASGKLYPQLYPLFTVPSLRTGLETASSSGIKNDTFLVPRFRRIR